jgi:hypothetical protein
MKIRKQKQLARIEERKLNLKRYQDAETGMAAYQSGAPATDSMITSNFFRVSWESSDKQPKALHRYRIELDKVDDFEPTNKDMRREYVQGLF